MRTWLLRQWNEFRTNYWFLPAVMAVGAAALAMLTLELDREIQASEHPGWDWAYSGGPEGARAVLSTIAGSMISVAGVVFSITIVALSLTSGQFGPRLLRNFIRDRSNQFVLGAFTANFVYYLLVLRTVRGSNHDQFVPGISVSVGIALALLGLGVFTYFIHHVAISIQATQVIAAVNQELHATIHRLWPHQLGQEPASAPHAKAPPDDEATPIEATASGYVDAVSEEDLVRLAREKDLVVRLARRAGHFVVQGSPIAFVWPRERASEELRDQINGLFTLSSQATPFQDVEFAIDQLVEIAVRALSPGINDPFTAMTCIDRLGEALCELARRAAPSPYRCDADGRLRVIAHPAAFGSIADAAFNQIRQYGRGSAAVLIRMLEALASIANHARREADRAALRRHAELVHRAAAQGLPEEADRNDVDERYTQVLAALQGERKQATP